MAPAMGLLHKPFSPESLSGSSSSSAPVSSDRATGSNLSTLALLELSKETIEAVSNMLQCSCAETGYLRIMLPNDCVQGGRVVCRGSTAGLLQGKLRTCREYT
jgi:hypothetical protein